jgi:hypothetical protein
MIRKKSAPTEIVIDLTGPDGNAFMLMAWAKRLSPLIEDLHTEEGEWNAGINDLFDSMDIKTKGLPVKLSDRIVQEMMSGDYENLLRVFDRYFGSFVILER